MTKKDQPPSIEELKEMMRLFNVTTERLKASHDALERRVAELQDELSEKNRELERARRLAALGELSAGVAHEIRNPLGGIQLSASLLEGEVTEEPQKKLVAKILSGVSMLDAIVGDLLEFTNYREADIRPVLLADLLSEAIDYAGPEISARGHKVSQGPLPDDARVLVDGSHVVRAFLNLVLNAVQAMDEPGTITVEAAPGEGAWIVRISDTGPGIPDEAADKLFNPFFTTKETGTGLGLAIVHKIIGSHNGSIKAENGTDGGAAFTVTLPAAPAEADNAADTRS
jgi:signal transduction histidine kinase